MEYYNIDEDCFALLLLEAMTTYVYCDDDEWKKWSKSETFIKVCMNLLAHVVTNKLRASRNYNSFVLKDISVLFSPFHGGVPYLSDAS